MKQMTVWRLLFPLLVVTLLVAPSIALAQDATPSVEPIVPTIEPIEATPEPTIPAAEGDIPQVHSVTEGENLTIIAMLYNVSVADLMAVNNLTETDLIQIGQELIIPGGEGEIIPTNYTVRAGDTLRGVAAEFNTTIEALAVHNRLVSLTPSLATGQIVNLDSRTGSTLPQAQTGRPYLVAAGDTMLSVAARFGISPTRLASANELESSAVLIDGQRLKIPDESVAYRDLPDGWVDLQVRPQEVAQGETLSIYVQNLMEGDPTGQLADQTLRFTPFGRGYTALVGLDAFTEPGFQLLTIGGRSERSWQPLEVTVRVGPTEYDTQYVEVGAELSGLLDPQLRSDDDALLSTIYSQFRPEQLWQGVFQLPVDNAAISAAYGGSRSYNGGPIETFHSGVDFAVPEGTPIVSPAAGVVVFNDLSELRGNVVIIDHGLGVMSGFYHLSESQVTVGDELAAGQQIGLAGSTGLSSGTHLHWEVRVMDVAVNGLQWTEQAFP